MSELKMTIYKAAYKCYTDKARSMKRAGYSTGMISRILSIPEGEVIKMCRME